MALTKRLLSIALALLLGLAVLAPGVMAEDDPNAPVITKQPTTKFRFSIPYVQAGTPLAIEALAVLPEGAKQGTLSYAWYDYDWQPGDTKLPVTTGASASIPTTEDMLFKAIEATGIKSAYADLNYCVVVTNTWFDDEQTQQSTFIKSEVVKVKLFADYGTAITIYWKDAMDDGFFKFLVNLPLKILTTFIVLFGILGCKLNPGNSGLGTL